MFSFQAGKDRAGKNRDAGPRSPPVRKTLTEIFGAERDELHRIINTGGDIVGYLNGRDSPICPLMGNDVRLGKFLGKGTYGEVFELVFVSRSANGGPDVAFSKRYAVKKAKPTVESIEVSRIEDFDTLVYMVNDYGLDVAVVEKYNRLPPGTWGPGKPVVAGLESGEIAFPLFLVSCVSDMAYKRIDQTDAETIVPPGSSVCEDSYSELVHSILSGDLYRSGRSINFIDTFAFSVCQAEKYSDRNRKYEFLTFMEQIDGTMRSMIVELAPYMKNIIVQIMFGVAVLQTLGIVHGDLKDDNIFIERVTENTVWDGLNVQDAKYFKYVLNGTPFYLPACPYIVKIGDWGLSCKYSKPMILNKTTMETGYDQYDGEGPWLPNWCAKAYDPLHILMSTKMLCARARIAGQQNPTLATNFESDFPRFLNMAFSVLTKGVNVSRLEIGNHNGIFTEQQRPKVSQLASTLSSVSAESFLSDIDVMRPYMKVPDDESMAIQLGEI